MTTATVESAIELGRLRRALFLDAQRVGTGRRYIVDGGASTHCVDLDAYEGQQCDCPDYLWRENMLCKHVLLARLLEGDWGSRPGAAGDYGLALNCASRRSS